MITLSFSTVFDVVQRKFKIQDTSNYSGQGVSLANVKGVIKMTSPRGVIYDNTNYLAPDVNPSVSLSSGYINLPVNALGFVLAGVYTVDYHVLYSVDGSISTISHTYSYSFIVPAIDITQTADGYNSVFSSVDSSVYGSYASISRTHIVTPPVGSPLSVVSNSNQTISYAPNIWSGIWTSQITTVLTYVMGDGLIINATLTATKTVTAYLNDMNVIRGYIENFKILFDQARASNKELAYRIEISLTKINTAYSEYDLALFYNDLLTAYLRTVDIVKELSDYVTITFPAQIIPFVNNTGGSSHPPVSISSPPYGVSINSSQVLTFSLATTSSGGMLTALSGNVTDYLGGDGNFHAFSSSGYALKSDFTDYASVTAITGANITNWQTAFGWGNHASAGYALAANVYTKTNLQTSGQASVHWGNITNHPTTISGYGITDAMVGNSPITGATHTKISYDSKGLVTGGVDLSASDIPALPWSKITSGIPTTIAGYGITNAYTKTEVDNKTWLWSAITSTPTTVLGYGITNVYTKAEVDAKTWAWSAITSTPTTLAGYGITNALSTLSPAASVINTGTGSQFLADDGTYKPITLSAGLDTQVVYINGTVPSGDTNFLFDNVNKRLTVNQIVSITHYVENLTTYISKDVSNNMVFTDAISGPVTLASLISGATNFWTSMSGGIYYSGFIGVNSPSSLDEALTVNGNIEADYFNSSYLRYKNGNLLLGPNAGDNETGNDKLYIHNTNTSTPLIYGEFSNRLLTFNADLTFPTSHRVLFRSAVNSIMADSSNNITFQDGVANTGSPVKLVQLMDGTYNSLKADFADYTAVTSITAGNKTTWNKASVIITSGSGNQYLADNGTYTTIPYAPFTDDFAKFDTTNINYRFYTDKTEAGGVSSAGKLYKGTTNPTATNRVNYDGYFYATAIYSNGSLVNTHAEVTIGTANGLSIATGQVLSLGLSSSSTNGALSSTDWSTFNTKYSGLPSQTGHNGNYLTTNGTTESWVAIADGILQWTGASYTPFTSQVSGSFDSSTTDPIHTTRLNYDGDFWVNKSSYKEADWIGGNVIYVPIDGDIQTYVNNAVAGDTLILASGEYTITSGITINKALNIVGQGNAGYYTIPSAAGHGTLIQSSSISGLLCFSIQSTNVRLAHLSINLTGGDSTGITTSNNLDGIVLTNVDVIVNCSGLAQGIMLYGSNAVLRNITFYVISADSDAIGLYFYNNTLTTGPSVCDCFSVTGIVQSGTGGDNGWCFYADNSNCSQTLTLNLSTSVCKALPGGATTNIAVASTSSVTNNSIVNAYFCTLEGADYDAYQTGTNQLNVGGSVLVNDLIFGTITYRARMTANNLTTSVLKTSGSTQNDGYFYTGTVVPIHTTRLNYDGDLYVKDLYSSGFVNINTNGDAISINTFKASGLAGNNFFIGNGGASASGTGSQGSYNLGIGTGALLSVTTGHDNVAVGYQALSSATTAFYSTAIGVGALKSLTTFSYSTAVGYHAAYNVSTGGSTVAVGYEALLTNISGSYNTAVGTWALRATTNGNNTAVGYSAMLVSDGSNNVSIGSNSMLAHISGSSNVAVGFQALKGLITGSASVAIGNNALLVSTAGGNTAVGSQSLTANTTGSDNVGLGVLSLFSNTTGAGNLGIGTNALHDNITSGANVALGINSLYSITGNDNVAIGYNSGRWITGGSTANITSTTSVYIGSSTKALVDGGVNEIVIGYNAVGNGSNSFTFGTSVIVKSILYGNVGIGIVPGTGSEKLEVAGNIISKGIVWTSRTSAVDNDWRSVAYGNGLFVAVSSSGTGNRVMTSPDGINWTSRTSAADNNWESVAYGNGIFVAVSDSGTGNRIMISLDGISWASRTSAVDNNWNSVAYGGGIFVAVSSTGTGNRVMTSSDGVNWVSRTSAADNGWLSVTYGNGLFVAVSQDGTGNRVMSSPDGITWTSRTSAADNIWNSVTYGNGLFVAVSSSGTGNRVMTSPNGITWTSRTDSVGNNWASITYGNRLFVAVSHTGTGDRVMTSPDGINWTSRTSAADNNWPSVAYGNGLFVAVSITGTGNRVMTSGKQDLIVNPDIYINSQSILQNQIFS